MVKLLSAFLCLLFLCPCARGTEIPRKEVALTFDPGTSSREIHALLDELNRQDISATFFLRGRDLEQDPALAQAILDAGHEIGIQSYYGTSLEPLSRRAIAREFSDTRALLPGDCDVNFLRPPEMIVSDGVRQVAQVTGLSIAHWRLSPADNILHNVRDGDILRLPLSHEEAAATIRGLRQQGFQFLTLTELARRQDVHLRPGRTYDAFPDN